MLQKKCKYCLAVFQAKSTAHYTCSSEVCEKQVIKSGGRGRRRILPKYMSGMSGRDWLREKVRIRDKHTCQHCKKKWQQGERRLDVHHLDESRQSVREYKADELDRLITLCHRCHLKHYTNWNRIRA